MNATKLPRLDVGYSAFVASVTGLIVLGLNALMGLPVETAIIGPAAVVIVAFLVGYFVPTMKELAVSLAGAVVVIVQAIVSASQGGVIDTALVTTAVTAIVNALFVYLLPRLQPFTRSAGGETASGFWRRP